MRGIKNHSGYTLLEVAVASAFLGIIVISVMSMMIGTAHSYETSTVQAQTNSDAVIAMQHIVSDAREAKSFTVGTGQSSLTLTFPITTADGYYDRRTADTANQVTYYLSNQTGNQGTQGTFLWRSCTGGAKRIVGRNLNSLLFDADDAAETRAVKITVVTQNSTSTGPEQTELTERVVYLRNY